MSLSEIAVIGIAIFLVLMFLRMPVGISMAIAGFIGVCLIRGVPASLSNISLVAFRTVSAPHLSVIPLFLLMGALAAEGGVSKDAFSSLNKWIGHFPGGLAMATTGACAAFAAVCGAHIATATTMVKAALPEMRRYRYSDELSLGCISAGGNLGFLIPPSGALIVYGFITQTPVGPLFIAGILPGILLTLLFMLAIYVACKINPKLAPPADKVSWIERLKGLGGIWGILIIFIIVMGGIYVGIFTPTEAGAIGAFATLLLALINRKLTWKGFVNSLYETMFSTAMIFLIIIGAMIFGSFLTASEVTNSLAEYVAGLNISAYGVLIAILMFYIICGFFMEIFALLLVSLPIVFPIVTSLGFDPIAFGVLCVLTIMIGTITPPFGIVVFAVHGMVRDVPLFTIFRGCVPFFVAMIVCLVLLVAFPKISLVLPSLMLPYR